MNITLPKLIIAAVLLAVPLGVVFKMNRQAVTQWAIVLGRWAFTMVVIAFVYFELLTLDRFWMSALWALLSGGLATACWCRKRGIGIPLYLSMVPVTFAMGLLLLWLSGLTPVTEARYFLPAMAILQAACLETNRRGLAAYQQNRKVYAGLESFLSANGARRIEALRPLVAGAIRRAFAPSLQHLLVEGLVFLPFTICGLVLGGVDVLQAFAFSVVTAGVTLCSAMLTLLLSICIYESLRG